MKSIIKIEALKGHFIRWIILAILVSLIILLGVDSVFKNMVADYVELSLDVYLYFTMINIMLMIALPLFLLVMNIYIMNVEREGNGWQLVISNMGSCRLSILGKLLLNVIICIAVYLVMNIFGCHFLYSRGVEIALEAVCIPLALSLICYLLNITVIFYICLLMENVISRVVVSILEIILVLGISQTEYSAYCPLCYAYIIAMNLEHAAIKVVCCIILVLVLWIVGIRFSDDLIKKRG